MGDPNTRWRTAEEMLELLGEDPSFVGNLDQEISGVRLRFRHVQRPDGRWVYEYAQSDMEELMLWRSRRALNKPTINEGGQP